MRSAISARRPERCLTGWPPHSVTSAEVRTSACAVWNGLLRLLSCAAGRPCADRGTRISGAPFFQILSISSPAFQQGAQKRWSLHRRWGRQDRQRRCPWASSTTLSRRCCRYSPTSRSHSFGSYHEPYCYSCPSTVWRPCYSIQGLFRFLVHWRSRRLP
jgi:hypothetical protein